MGVACFIARTFPFRHSCSGHNDGAGVNDAEALRLTAAQALPVSLPHRGREMLATPWLVIAAVK